MNRKNDVGNILTAAAEQFEHIQKDYDRALREKSLDLRVPVKNIMENLRSALDYMAHDIYETCCQPARKAAGKPDPRNIYFPYGRTESDFRSGAGNSLPDLGSTNNDVFQLIESIQPHLCNDTWLYDLCSILNENKHDRLKAQVRSETDTHSVDSPNGSVTVIVNNPGVKITSLPGAVRIFGVPAEFSGDGIKTAPSNELSHRRTTWVAFTFEDSVVNVLGLLQKALREIRTLYGELYIRI